MDKRAEEPNESASAPWPKRVTIRKGYVGVVTCEVDDRGRMVFKIDQAKPTEAVAV